MIAFVHVAKTGGRSIEAMLRSAHGWRHCVAPKMHDLPPGGPDEVRFTIPKYNADDVALLKRIMPGMRSLGGHHIALWSGVEQVFPDVKYLLFLRDPVKRGASHYQYHLASDDFTERFGFRNFAWDDWVEWETHHNHQLKMISPNVDVDEAIRLLESERVFVGLMERFDESLVLFRQRFCPDLKLAYRRKNTARSNDVARSLLEDERKREQLREMYALEFPLYEHVVNEIYPRYLKEYGPTLEQDVARFVGKDRQKVNNLNLARYHAYRRYFFLPRIKKLTGS